MGVVIGGLPAGKINMTDVLIQMRRRAPGLDNISTSMVESDTSKILSRVVDNVTTGAPLCAIIDNMNCRSGDHSNLCRI